jgi:hypothetical protein
MKRQPPADPLLELPFLSAEADAPPPERVGPERLDDARLTPAQMVQVGLDYSRMAGPTPGVGFLDGLIDIILFLPLDQLTALRTEFLPAPTTEVTP